MRKQKLLIKRPDDSGKCFPEVIISSEAFIQYYADSRASIEKTIHHNHNKNKKDPIHEALVLYWKGVLDQSILNFKSGPILLYIEELPIALESRKGRFRLNGKSESKSTITHALARVTFAAINKKSAVELLKVLMRTLSLSESVKYCLENKVPFHFYDNFDKISVRLNIQQISDKECALEISDGIWGVIKNKDLDRFCTFFQKNKKMGKYKFMGIKRLYSSLLGKDPTDSQLKLMREFLKQNRQKDIVERRAVELLEEMQEQYSDRFNLIMEDGVPQALYIKGKGYDWKLTNNEFKNEIQMVSTYVCQPVVKSDEEGIPIPFEECEWIWKGPICIDNMTRDSPLGDQFAARAFALLNDTMTIQIVNTIKRYLITDININRKDFDEMLRVRDK